MAKIIKIEGVGPVNARKLRDVGIATTQALLEAGASAKGRQEIAEKAGIQAAMILKWVNHADLFRIKGVGEEYAELLEVAGVDTVPELAQRNADNLYEKLTAVNQEKNRVRRLPSSRQVADWVEQAKQLPRKVHY